MAPPGTASTRGAELAVEEINAAGGIKAMGGSKLELLKYDTQSKPEVGQAAAEKALADGVEVVLGSAQTAVAELISQTTERRKVININTLGSADSLSQRGFKYFFRVMPTATQQARGDLDLLAKIGGGQAKKIAVIYEDTPYGQDALAQYKKLANEFGLQVADELAFKAGSPDVSATVSRAKSGNPDSVLLVTGTQQDSIVFVRAFKEQDFNPKLVLGKQFGGPFIEALGKDAEYLLQTAWWTPNTDAPGAPKGRSQKLADDYQKKYGQPIPEFAMLGHTAVMVLRDALERASTTDSDKVREALLKTSIDGSKGVVMLVPQIEFTENGDNKQATTLISQVLGGRQAIVWPTAAAEKQAVFPLPEWSKR